MTDYNGALIDERPEEEKIKDYTFKEIVASADTPNWKEKKESEWIKYPIYNQGNSDQCVAFTLIKLMAITHLKDEGEWIEFSASDLYERRINNTAGMGSDDAFRLLQTGGVTLAQLYPNKIINNNTHRNLIKKHYRKVGEVFKIENYIHASTKDMDAVASIIQKTGKGVMVWFWGSFKEWDRVEPSLIDTQTNLFSASVRHSVTCVDFFLINGKKFLLIEDSWGNKGKEGRRLVSEDFFSRRNYYAGYLMNFQFESSNTSEKYFITKPQKFGDTNEEIKEIQRYLQNKGYFPKNISLTGFYGAITANAILSWQLDNKVDREAVLLDLRGHFFGVKSLKVLNI